MTRNGRLLPTLLWVILYCSGIPCQITSSSPMGREFEVVSLKPAKQDAPLLPPVNDPSSFILNGASLRGCILYAFGLMDYQLSAPDWTGEARYDLSARKPPGTTEDDVPLMMQRVLERRFNLQSHRSTRVQRAYVLTIAPVGPRLSAVSDCSGHLRFGPHTITARCTSLAGLAAALTRYADRPVLDRTDLKGTFDFTLNWEPDQIGATPLFRTVERELGIRTRMANAPVEFIVVDHLDKQPTDN